MGATTLNDVMERRFHELKNNFKRASAKNNITFAKISYTITTFSGEKGC